MNPITGWLPPEQGGVAMYFGYPQGHSTDTVDLHRHGGPLVGAGFEVDVRLTTTNRDNRPIVNDVRLGWQRP